MRLLRLCLSLGLGHMSLEFVDLGVCLGLGLCLSLMLCVGLRVCLSLRLCLRLGLCQSLWWGLSLGRGLSLCLPVSLGLSVSLGRGLRDGWGLRVGWGLRLGVLGLGLCLSLGLSLALRLSLGQRLSLVHLRQAERASPLYQPAGGIEGHSVHSHLARAVLTANPSRVVGASDPIDKRGELTHGTCLGNSTGQGRVMIWGFLVHAGGGQRVSVVYCIPIVDREVVACPRASGETKLQVSLPTQSMALRHILCIRHIRGVLINLDADAGLGGPFQTAGMHPSCHFAKSATGELPGGDVLIVTVHLF